MTLNQSIDRAINRQRGRAALLKRAEANGGKIAMTPAAARFLLQRTKPTLFALYSFGWFMGFTVNGIPPHFPIPPRSWLYNQAME